ncbi:MAG: RecX family transcriptional regulator [Bacteroidetes bacterium]|nr:MAG: RecX family transcriptional regulator [Bacteroidota bacterium]
MFQKKRLTKDQAFEKAKHFCGYQERSHAETKEKLYSLGLYKSEVEEVISRLIEEDYLNEERFATQFAGGKFRIKHWGRNKIKYGLKERQISEYCIRKALKQINDTEYEKTLEKLAETKWLSLKGEKNIFTKLRKTQDYLLQKGFEYNLISPILRKLQTES